MSAPYGLNLNWQSLAMLSAFAVSITTFAIQMGAVQTQVAINTKLIEGAIDYQKISRERLAKLDDVQAQINNITENVEKRRVEAASKADVSQLLNTTRVEFLAEIKRLDEKSAGMMSQYAFAIWRQERDVLIGQMLKRIDELEKKK